MTTRGPIATHARPRSTSRQTQSQCGLEGWYAISYFRCKEFRSPFRVAAEHSVREKEPLVRRHNRAQGVNAWRGGDGAARMAMKPFVRQRTVWWAAQPNPGPDSTGF